MKETQSLVRSIMRELKEEDYVSKSQEKYLSAPIFPHPRRFYLSPKIHKPPETLSVPFKIPVVSDWDCESFRITAYRVFSKFLVSSL